MPCSCETPKPKLEPGVKIHHKKLWEDRVRINGKCPSYLRYLSDEWAVVEYFSSNGGRISEKVFSRRDFDDTFEVCPGG